MLDPGKAAFVPKKGKPNVIMFVGLQGELLVEPRSGFVCFELHFTCVETRQSVPWLINLWFETRCLLNRSLSFRLWKDYNVY